MDFEALSKVALFWLAFYITPGPVWVAIMETTRDKTITQIFKVFFKVFLPGNVSVQFSQAIICVVFIEYISRIFVSIGSFFYLIGAFYILFLAFKVLMSKQKNTSFDLSLANLLIIMIFSPKIWLLFPAGAAIAVHMSANLWINAVVFAVVMVVISNFLFFFHILIGKLGAKILKDNFAYFNAASLCLFAVLLLVEFFTNLP